MKTYREFLDYVEDNIISCLPAEYAGGTLELQRSELRKGGWFDRDHMPEIPGRVSLARRLIDHWLEQSAEA